MPQVLFRRRDLHTCCLRMPPREWARLRFLRAVPSLAPASPVWSSPSLTVALAKFIKATATGFPDGMPPLGTDSPYSSPSASPRPSAAHSLPPVIPMPWSLHSRQPGAQSCKLGPTGLITITFLSFGWDHLFRREIVFAACVLVSIICICCLPGFSYGSRGG